MLPSPLRSVLNSRDFCPHFLASISQSSPYCPISVTPLMSVSTERCGRAGQSYGRGLNFNATVKYVQRNDHNSHLRDEKIEKQRKLNDKCILFTKIYFAQRRHRSMLNHHRAMPARPFIHSWNTFIKHLLSARYQGQHWQYYSEEKTVAGHNRKHTGTEREKYIPIYCNGESGR